MKISVDSAGAALRTKQYTGLRSRPLWLPVTLDIRNTGQKRFHSFITKLRINISKVVIQVAQKRGRHRETEPSFNGFK